MHHVHKRKNFWSVISEELGSQNIEVSELACKKKWQNLVLTYKNTKDVQSKTGRGPVKFTFYNRLDELLGDSPSSASPHSLDVNELQSQVEPTLNFDSDTSSERPSCSNDSSCMQKRKNPSMELVKVKKKFFEEKMEKIKEKEISRKLYVEESLKYKKEKLDLYKEKLEMEKKKIKALEDLQKILKEKKYIKY
ncbi:trihelix transcription factor GT-3b-like [Formica exsecta]|uniref:trihelix transcription factor GT-3b-like n=1 Tax=Formica exsecta TaxID=72781 RepID=UPI001145177D|nr:trihelix transcription factor GT-3b-like [Formica exsecta]